MYICIYINTNYNDLFMSIKSITHYIQYIINN